MGSTEQTCQASEEKLHHENSVITTQTPEFEPVKTAQMDQDIVIDELNPAVSEFRLPRPEISIEKDEESIKESLTGHEEIKVIEQTAISEEIVA